MLYEDPPSVWKALERLAAQWHEPRGFGAHRYRIPGPLGLHDTIDRLGRLRDALQASCRIAQQRIVQRLVGLDLAAVWPVLWQACEDIALCYGGSALLGAGIGTVAGSFLGGVGALPGAVLGASAGAQAANGVLALLGLKSLLEGLVETLPQALNCYERGVREAWIGPSGVHHASGELAEGHVLLMMAILSALAAYMGRGPGDKARLLAAVRDSQRLGPRMADWLAQNEVPLREHPALQPRRPDTAQMAAPAHGGEPAVTPGQLRQARGEPPPEAAKPIGRRMPQKNVPCFKANDLPPAKLPEFDRQLAGQERGVNEMTVQDYLRGREAFDEGAASRDPGVARQAREEFGEKLKQDLTEDLRRSGLSAREAEAKAVQTASERMKTLAALHTPDMVAGGKDVIGDFGDRNINSRIGAQWRSRVDELDRAARAVPPSERGQTKMNAKLERCK